jgi:hypothetical protein
MGFISLECIGERVLQNCEVLTSSELSIGRDVWQAINISLTHSSEKSKDRLVRIHEARTRENIAVVNRGEIWVISCRRRIMRYRGSGVER